jgi:hypothetical protein
MRFVFKERFFLSSKFQVPNSKGIRIVVWVCDLFLKNDFFKVPNFKFQIPMKLTLFWNLVFGTWYLELGIWYLELGTWYLELGTWYLELGIWNLVFGTWNLELET